MKLHLFRVVRIMCALLFFALLELLHPSTAVAANTVSGYCGGEGDGTNLTWELNLDTGEMVISGTGAMEDSVDYTAPWGVYTSKIKSLTISDGVTTIGNSAFCRCINLTGELDIPNSIVRIGKYAFQHCGFTGSLNIPDSVTYIGGYAFEENAFTGTLRLSNNLTEIEDNTFANCKFSGPLNLPAGLTRIGAFAFHRGEYSGSLIIPDSVTFIGEAAFSLCQKFTGQLTLSKNLTSIGTAAFQSCRGFSGSLYIPDSVETIGDRAFQMCDGFTGTLKLPHNITKIDDNTFSNCNFTGSLFIPNKVTTIGNEAFYSCGKITGNLTLPNSLMTIGNKAFEGCYSFTGPLTIPNTVTNIGYDAFRSCSGLSGALTIPNSLTTIESGTFSWCSGLTGELVIPDTVTIICDHAFYGCDGFDGNLKIPSNVVFIGEYAFFNCKGFMGPLTIPASVSQIGYAAFKRCNGINKAVFLGNAPSVIEAGNKNSTFNSGLVLYFDSTTSGWSYPTWNGYHTESLGGLPISGQTVPLDKSKYKIMVLNAEDRETPVANATVTLAGQSGKTDQNGYAILDATAISPTEEHTLTVIADGYQPYTFDAYILKQSYSDTLWVSRYIKTIQLTAAGEKTDVLLAERKLNKFYNDTPFSIRCESGEGIRIDSYVLRQGEREIATSTDGTFLFNNLDNLYAGTGTTEGRNLYIDIYQNGKKQATYPLNISVININVDNKIPGELSIGKNIKIVLPGDYPIVGGMELNVPVPLVPITCKIEGEKVHLGVNFDIGKRDDENKVHLLRLSGLGEADITKWMDKYYNAVATNKISDLSKKTFSFKPQIIGYLEGSVHGDEMKGKIYISLKVDFYREFQPVQTPPIVLEISVNGVVTSGGTIEIKQQEIKFYSDLEGKITFGTHVGLGIKDTVSVGPYGEGKVGLKWILAAQTPEDRGLQEIYLSGDFGIKAKMLGYNILKFPLLKTDKVYIYNKQTSLQTRITDMPPLAGQSMSLRLMNALAEELALEDEISLAMGAWSNGATLESGAMSTIGESTYQDAQPQMVTSGGTGMLLLHGSDTTLQYSLYENGSWTEPVPISPDGTEDGMFHAAADDENIYVVWQDAKTPLGENETTETIAQNIDLVMAVYDIAEGSWSSEIPVKVQENSVAEIMPHIDVEAGSVAIAWIENSANNMFGVCLPNTEGESATNAICTATCTMPSEGSWGGSIQWSYGEAIVEEGHMVTSLDVNALPNESIAAIESTLMSLEDGVGGAVTTPDVNAQSPEATPAQTEEPIPTPQQTPNPDAESQPTQTPDATEDVQGEESSQVGEVTQGGEAIPEESVTPGDDTYAGNGDTTAEDIPLPEGDILSKPNKQAQGELITANLEPRHLSSRRANAANPMSLKEESEIMPDAAPGITPDTSIATPDIIPEASSDTSLEATPGAAPEIAVETESTDEALLQGTGQSGGFCQILYTIDAGDELLSTEEDVLYYVSFSTESSSWIKSAALATGAAACQFNDEADAPVWWQNGKVHIGQAQGTIESVESVETGSISDGYILLPSLGGDQILIYTSMVEGRAELFALSKEDGAWGKPVQLTEQSQNIRNATAAYIDGKITASFVQYTATETEESGNLCVMVLPADGVAKITAATYDSSDVMAGHTLPLELSIENQGTKALHGLNIIITGPSGETLYNNTITQSILAGEQADITLGMPLPETISGKGTYTVQIDESSYEVEIGHALLKTGFDLFYPGGSPNLVCYVRNDGYEPASGSLVIRDTATKAEVYRTPFEPLSNGELLHIEFALPLLDITRSYSVEIETTAEQLYENGQEYIAVYPAKTEGDAYHDGYVNLADVLMLCRRIEDGETQHPYTVYVSDRGDGIINIDDAQYWLAQLAQTSPRQP